MPLSDTEVLAAAREAMALILRRVERALTPKERARVSLHGLLQLASMLEAEDTPPENRKARRVRELTEIIASSTAELATLEGAG